jgi:hypothetical protein
LHRLKLSIYPGLTCLVFSFALAKAQTPLSTMGPVEFAGQLRKIGAGLDTNSPFLPASLPEQWNVVTPEGRYSISSQPLRALFGAGRFSVARHWVGQMAEQLESYSDAPPESASAARDSLNKILARREFSDVHPPSPWDLFRERVAAWLASQLQRIFAAVAQRSGGGRILFWIIVAVATGFLAMWLIQLWSRADPMLTLPRVVPGPAARSSDTWLHEARQAEARGQWREAIRCAYWAAIARLQETGALPEDRTRTPREYLRSIRADQPASGPLRALTLGLERFWYAKQTAGAKDFDESLKYLGSLGCKVE